MRRISRLTILVVLIVLTCPLTAADGKAKRLPGSTVHGWGDNGYGQIGTGKRSFSGCYCLPPSRSAVHFKHIVQVSAGFVHSLALGADGTVWAWGSDANGELGNGKTSGNGCKCYPYPVRVRRLKHVVAISAGTAVSYALRRDGTVWAWGNGERGQLGDGDPKTSGCKCRPNPHMVTGLPSIFSISAGDGHAIALDRSGHVWAWGWNSFGQLGAGSASMQGVDCECIGSPVPVAGLGGVVSIDAGNAHSLALLRDGTVRAWGDDRSGQLGNGKAVTTGCVCEDRPVKVTGLNEVKQVAAGANFSLALLKSGSIVGWGRDDIGQLGDGGAATPVVHPVPAGGSRQAVGISAQGAFALARTSTGNVFAWGADDSGQLGRGTASTNSCMCSTTPVNVAVHARQMSAGFYHALILDLH